VGKGGGGGSHSRHGNVCFNCMRFFLQTYLGKRDPAWVKGEIAERSDVHVQGEVPQATFDKQGGSRFVNHTRRLSRFAPGGDPTPRRSESITSLPMHHSRRSSVSEVSNFSEAESVGSLMRPLDDFQATPSFMSHICWLLLKSKC